MARYLFPWSATDGDAASDHHLSWTAEIGTPTRKSSTAGYFYPPKTAPQAPIAINHPLPNVHEYSHTTAPSTLNSGGEREKPVQLSPNRLDIRMDSPTPPASPPVVQRKLHPSLKILLFLVADVFLALCLGAALSVVYLLVGHAILRATHPARYSSTPLLASINAGAVGGVVFALPLALLVVALVPPKEPPPDDFFDDDTGQGLIQTLLTWRSISRMICGVLAMTFGAVAGPIGVLCLGGGREGTDIMPEHRMLAPAHAAAAGAVGGAVGGPGVLVSVMVVLTLLRNTADYARERP